MLKNYYTKLLLLGCFLAFHASSAQKIEAESATLAGGATIVTDAAKSGGAFVQQQAGTLTFQVTIPTAAFYNIYVYGASVDGIKINPFVVNGNSTDFTFNTTTFSKLKVVSTLKLSAGQNTMAINHSYGYISIDYIELEVTDASSRFNITKTLNDPKATKEATALYQFLMDNYGKKVISGAMTLNSISESSQWLDFIKTNTGKEPALIGIDFLQGLKNTTWYDDTKPATDAIAYYNRHGIPALMWHWRDPSVAQGGEFYTKNTSDHTDGTAFDITKINDPSSGEYKAMIADIDLVAVEMLKIQAAGAAAVWRPLHEAAGGWFWWGAKGGAACKKLWQVMYDRMVNYHGVHNLIWVWTYEPKEDGTWYPGDEFVDIVGRDIYKDGDHTSQVLEFNKISANYAGKKMVALSECGSIPDIENMEKDGAYWSWFMPWYKDYTTDAKYNTVDLWKKLMTSTSVITLDEMPDLRTYVGTTAVESQEKNMASFNLFPSLIDDSFIVGAPSDELLQVKIYSNTGKELMNASYATNHRIAWPNELKSGMYLIKINELRTFKVVKK